jgi:RNA-directed DNA polymerase
MDSTEIQNSTETKLKRIAWLSSKDPSKVFGSLIHHFNEESLRVCFTELQAKKARGADGVDKIQYGKNLDANLENLVRRMKTMSYRMGPVRQVQIPKDNGKGVRLLGISNFEDKIVQKMTHKILESIYEPLFLDCSYGFRPGRGCHDAIRALSEYLYKNEVEAVIDVDISNFFGTISYPKMVAILRTKVTDQKFMRYISRMFKAGVLADGDLVANGEGVGQGSLCSPVLSNIYAHEVIDVWFEKVVKGHCKGNVEMFRYCDDLVICCQYQRDAERIKEGLSKRLAKFGLALNEEKTRLVQFSKEKARQKIKQEAFDFLGFTFYLGKSLKGALIPKVKTDGLRLRKKLKRVNAWAREVRNKAPLKEIWAAFCRKLEGHIQYYGVSFNVGMVRTFRQKSIDIMFKWLNRRSQRKSFSWEKFELFMGIYPPPKARICHVLF